MCEPGDSLICRAVTIHPSRTSARSSGAFSSNQAVIALGARRDIRSNPKMHGGGYKKSSIRVAQVYRDQSECIGTNREMRGGARQVDQHWVAQVYRDLSESIGTNRERLGVRGERVERERGRSSRTRYRLTTRYQCGRGLSERNHGG